MITYLLSLSALAAALTIISIVFREKASSRVIYAAWLLLAIRICIPVSDWGLSASPARSLTGKRPEKRATAL